MLTTVKISAVKMKVCHGFQNIPTEPGVFCVLGLCENIDTAEYYSNLFHGCQFSSMGPLKGHEQKKKKNSHAHENFVCA